MNREVGMIGLGRMGANMVRRLMRKGHQCVVFNRSPKPVQELVREGAAGAGSLSDLVKQLSRPRAIWMMVPAAVVDQQIADLLPECFFAGISEQLLESGVHKFESAAGSPHGNRQGAVGDQSI